MRLDSTEVNPRRGRARVAPKHTEDRRSALRRSAIESLERRTLLATLPSPSVYGPIDVSNAVGAEYNPQVAVNPSNPLDVVAVWTGLIAPPTDGLTNPFEYAGAKYSTDGGQTWTAINLPNNLLDPNTSGTSTAPFGTIGATGVAFDANNNFYVLVDQVTGTPTAAIPNGSVTGSAGALVVTKYNFGSGGPTRIQSTTAYEWFNGDGSALHPSLAVDAGQATFSDVDSTGTTRTQTDPTAGNVYIAFTDGVIGPASATDYVNTSIAMLVSSDGGVTFGADTALDDLGRFGSAVYGEPSVVVSQGTSDGRVAGGQVTATWQDKGTLSTANPPETLIYANSLPNNPVSEVVTDNTQTPIADAGAGTPNIPAVTDIPLSVDITDARFTTLSNLTVKVNIVHPNLSQISIVLIPPTGSGLAPVTLVQNQSDQFGNTNANVGISGANLGVISANGDAIGTVFDDTAFRNIVDIGAGGARGASAPFVGRYQPEQRGGLSAFDGSDAATLNGTWTLQITDFVNGGTPAFLENWSLDFASGTQLAGEDVTAAVAVTPQASVDGLNVDTRPVIASDNTLGAYSPYQGRLYIAYVDHPNPIANPNDPATDYNIMLITSDDGGASWSEPVMVNDDDSLVDGYSQSDPTGVSNPITGRAQYQPELAVDQTTGTLAVSWLDTRNDASNGRTVYELTTSIDGGQTFSPDIYVNESQTATDAATGATVNQGPIPDNFTESADTNITLDTGYRQGLAFEAGHIYPVWSSNENAINTSADDSNVDIRVAPSFTAAGPRVVNSTMGPIGGPPNPDDPYPVNLTRAADGTPQASGIVVTFDRPVNPATFTTQEAQVFFTDTTANNATGHNVPIIAVVPLDAGFFGPAQAYGAENFEIEFEPSSSVGTYSYTVGPDISDQIRSIGDKVIPVGPAVNYPSANVPAAISDFNETSSALTISGVPANQVIANATVNFSIKYPFVSDLYIDLIAPDGTIVQLVSGEGGQGQNFTNTTLSDSAGVAISSGAAPFTGAYIPETPLSALDGKSLNGTWTLLVFDEGDDNFTGSLLDWSLNLTAGTLSNVESSGNEMDQNADSIDGELPGVGPSSSNDVYAAPDPKNGVLINTTDPTGHTYLLVGPYNQNTLPVIVPGPTVQSISNANFNGPQSFVAQGDETDIPIGSAATIDSTITVPDYTGGTITGLTLNTTISFPTDSDLTLTLIGPDGTSVVLASGVGGGGANFINTTFDGSSPNSITSGAAPFTGSFRPQESLLEAFNTLTPTGTWTLEITNAATGVTGTLTGWSLSFATDQDNLALNKTVSSIDVTFDRDMNPATVTPATVLSITGPDGSILRPYTYASTNAAQVIPAAPATGGSGVPLDSRFYVNDDGTFVIGDLGVEVNITSSNNAGLTLLLIGPDGTEVVLVSGAKGADFTNTVFDDSATQSISSGTAPYTGTFLPAQALSVFDGKELKGQWTLVAVNGLTGTTATLNSWALVATPTVTITPDPLGTDPNPVYPQTYQINFPTQQVSGTYTVQLASSITDSNGNALDTNQNAGVALLEGTAAPGSSAPVTYPSNTTPTTIVPNKTIESTLTVNGGFVIQTVSLTLNITYADDPNLTATLIAPDGTQIILFSGVGATGTRANFTNTLLEDSAPTPIEDAGSPFSSVTGYQPQEPLDVLVGRLVAGTYTLEITNSGTLTGTLNSWSMTFGRPLSISGLGEPVADQASESFRIFTTDPTQAISSTAWTAVGPAPITPTAENPTGGSGIVGALAVDPSDPSGNTVYVGGASGGVWKTTDFLTNNPAGPTYVPLTNFGPTDGQNIGGIAVFGRNNDPSQSIVIAGTGFADATNYANGTVGVDIGAAAPGTGFLISQDGGATWSLMDSSDNTLPFADRDHIFDGTSTFQVVVDPKLNPTTGGVIIYAALSGANGGIWRSLDTGLHWTKMLAGNASDVVLDPGSGTGVAGGNLQTVYAAIQGVGVFMSTNQGQSWNLMAGGQGNALLIDTNTGNPVPIDAPASTPNGPEGRIVLAKPALIPSTVANSAAENLFYSGWLYAAVVMPNDDVEGLYLTKDFGANWTLLKVSTLPSLDNGTLIRAVPTNDGTQPNYNYDVGGGDVTSGLAAQGNYDISLAIDPTNPNITYLGGTYNGQPTELLRVDATNAYDAHNVSAYTGNGPGGAVVQVNSTGSATVNNNQDAAPTPYLNYYRNPTAPFVADATLLTDNTASLTNTGAGVTWTPFDLGLNETGPEINGTFEQQLTAATPVIGDNIHRMITIVDPLTGYARLIIGTDNGVYSVVDNNGTYDSGIGSAQFGGPNKNGNLQLAAVNYGAVQASTASATVAGNLFASGTYSNGYATSDPDILNNGNLNYTSVGGDTGGVGVDSQSPTADPAYAGSNYVFFWPCCGGDRTDFFQVGQAGTDLVGRTSGLLQAANNGSTPDPQWPSSEFGANFAVNPVDGAQIIISSIDGRLFRTENQGLQWAVIADPVAQGGLPAALDGTYVSAPAFGAPDPAYTAASGNLDDFIYAGTNGVNPNTGVQGIGHIYVTQNGGGTAGAGNAWTDITNGDLLTDEEADPTPIEQIITDPTPGSHDAYAVTANGVYYNINTVSDPGQAGASTWVRITGNLFSLTHQIFGNSSETQSAVLSLNTIVADWRYVIPNPTGGTHPVLYVGGQGGVFQSLDNGVTWEPYPNTTADTPGSSGPSGGLPVADVTDLQISAGNIDPTTGRPVPVAGDPDVLVASTFGQGNYAIRLAPIVLNSLTLDPNLPPPSGSDSGISNTDDVTNVLQPVIDGQSEISAFGTTVTVNLYDLTPTTPGGPLQTPSAANFVGTATTNASGDFQVQVEAGHFLPNGATDGVKTLGVQAVDQSGAAGNVATITFTLITVPPAAPSIKLDPTLPPPNGSDTGVSPTDDITDVNMPYIDLVGVPTTGIYNLYRDNKLVASVVHTAANPLVGNTIAIQDPGPVPDGTHLYKAQVTDLAGNVGAFSSNLAVTIDTQIPATPPPPVLDPADDSGVKGDDITNVHQPRFDGTGVPGGLIMLIDSSGAVIGQASVAANGTYSVAGGNPLRPSAALPDGTYVFRVVSEDVAGNLSAPSTPLTITILSTTPATPTLMIVPADNSGPPGQNVTNNDQPRLQGTGTAGLDVELIDVKGNIAGAGNVITPVGDQPPVVVNLGGTFQLQFPSPLPDGTYVVLARVFDVAGNFADSTPLTLTIQTVAPSITTRLIIDPADAYGVVTAGEPVRTAVRRPVFGVSAVSSNGTPAAGTTIDLIDQATGAVIASAVTNSVGNALESPAGNLPDGAITLVARAVDVAGNLSTASAPLSLQVITVAGDYIGDGVGDLALFRPTTNQFLITEASGAQSALVNLPASFAAQPGDIPIQGDFDGDGKIDPAFYRPSTGTWYIDRSLLGPEIIQFGEPNVDIPVPADYDGDGLTDIAVYRPTTGQWLILGTQAGPEVKVLGGPAGFIPVPGDYDGDGKADIAVYLPSTGQWFIERSTAGPEVLTFGVPNVSEPVPADYDGDGKTDPAIYNPTTGQWILLQSTAGGKAVTLGGPGYEPVPLDYDGDGQADVAVFQTSTDQWTIQQSTAGTKIIGFGDPSLDVPVPLPVAYQQNGVSTLSVRSFSSAEVFESTTTASTSSSSSTPPASLDLGAGASRFAATSAASLASAIPPVTSAPPTVVPVAAAPTTPVALSPAKARAEARAEAKAKAQAALKAKLEAEAALRASRKAAHAHDLAMAALINGRRS